MFVLGEPSWVIIQGYVFHNSLTYHLNLIVSFSLIFIKIKNIMERGFLPTSGQLHPTSGSSD